MDFEKAESASPIEETVHIVSAYVGNNRVAEADLPALISAVYQALAGLTASEPKTAEPEPLVPAVPVKKSVTDDYLVCLEDGKKFKSLKRHLMTHYGLSPEDYRAKWTLPADYPMVAPSYAVARSVLAKTMGLGRKRAEASGEGEPNPTEAGPAEETN